MQNITFSMLIQGQLQSCPWHIQTILFKKRICIFFENAYHRILEPSAFPTQILDHLLGKIKAYAK